MSAELDFTKVNFREMDLAVGDYVTILGAFEQATDDLLTKLKQELTGHWEGPGGAKEFFEDHERKWNEAAARMRTNLTELKQAVQIANENYQAAEARNKSMWYNG